MTNVLFLAEDEISTLRESEEKLKTQQTEASRRENVLVMRLAAKEQEMQEYVVNIFAPLNIILLNTYWRVQCEELSTRIYRKAIWISSVHDDREYLLFVHCVISYD